MSSVKAMPWRIVLAALIGMFAATSTGSTRSPFLPDIASNLSVSLPAVANLFGLTAAAWVFAFAFFNGLARPPLLAALADVPVNVRGVVMGLNSSIASIGWLAAALIGGWLYAGVGFSGFSPVMAAMCFVAAAVVLPDSRLRQQQRD